MWPWRLYSTCLLHGGQSEQASIFPVPLTASGSAPWRIRWITRRGTPRSGSRHRLGSSYTSAPRRHAKQQCWANIFGSKSNSFLRVSTLNADLRGSPFANHLFQTFWDSDKLYLIDVAFVGKSKTRREPRGQPCTNNTYNIWRESTVKKSSRLHGHGTFRPTCELECGPTGARQLGIRGSYGME